MDTLVTGGAGFIGSNLVRLLCARGQRVRVLDDLSSGFARNLEGLPVELLRADVRDAKAVDEAVQGVSAVFHLAASVGNRRSIDDPIHDSEVNVLGTLRVLEAARRHDVRKVVFSSSAGIFGEPRELPLRADHGTEPDTPYGAGKLGAEKHCLAYSKLYGMENVALRYFNVYGVNQRHDAYGNVIPIFAHRLLRGQPIVVYGDGEQTRDFVNVRDVALANYLSATTPGVRGAFNIGSGTKITINELVALMEHAFGVKAEVRHEPPRAGDVRHSLADIEGAKAAFGFRPQVDLGEGLREYAEWARAEGV